MIAQRMPMQQQRSAAACRAKAVGSQRVRVCSVRAVARPSTTSSQKQNKQQDASLQTVGLAGAALLAPYVLEVGSALATGGDFGLLEGRTFALIHPLMMGTLFAYTGYAGYLGWQWRRTRELGEEVKALKATAPKVAVAAAGAEAAPPAAPTALDNQIAALEKERKELIAGGFRDKHFVAGSLLLGGGVTFSVAGCLNTWMRTGKLFPGPHLFAGAGIVVLWALAGALVPAMQKGDNNARSAHIALNSLNLALFAWQVPTGLEIVGKVFEFTSWP